MLIVTVPKVAPVLEYMVTTKGVVLFVEKYNLWNWFELPTSSIIGASQCSVSNWENALIDKTKSKSNEYIFFISAVFFKGLKIKKKN